MTWLLIGVLLVWTAVAVPAAVLIGRVVRTADARRAAEFEARAVQEAHVAGTDLPPSDVPPTPWTGPATEPLAPRLSGPHPRPTVVRHPVWRTERGPTRRDSGVF